MKFDFVHFVKMEFVQMILFNSAVWDKDDQVNQHFHLIIPKNNLENAKVKDNL